MEMPVKWRIALGIVLGLALILPIARTLGLAANGQRRSQTSESPAVSPLLSDAERRQILTYGRRCQNPEDCAPPLGCLSPVTGGESLCLASNCMTDLQCPEGFSCETLQSLGGSPLLRRCVLEGTAREGEPCIERSNARADVCARGLICNAYCGRPCRMEEPSSCPEGFFCGKGSNGLSCLPTCESRSCPEERQCVRFKSGFSVCAKVRGENCQEKECPQNQRCATMTSSGDREAVWMECVIPCDERSSCPTGSVCDLGVCRKPCSADAPDTCGPNLKCTEDPDKKRWLCGQPLD
jgi:hypothetical protein